MSKNKEKEVKKPKKEEKVKEPEVGTKSDEQHPTRPPGTNPD